MDATTPHGKAMLQMAAVFAELERAMIRDRVSVVVFLLVVMGALLTAFLG